MKKELLENIALRSLKLRVGVIREETGLSYQQALVVANRVEHLVQLLKKGEICFSYTRQDATVCHVRGTLLNYPAAFGRAFVNMPANRFLLYYDLDCDVWRTFHLAFLIHVYEIC